MTEGAPEASSVTVAIIECIYLFPCTMGSPHFLQFLLGFHITPYMTGSLTDKRPDPWLVLILPSTVPWSGPVSLMLPMGEGGQWGQETATEGRSSVCFGRPLGNIQTERFLFLCTTKS